MAVPRDSAVGASVLHVAQISFFLDPEGRAPAALLDAWPSVVDIAEIAVTGGARVSVLQACATSATLRRGEVSYHFVRTERDRSAAETPEFLARLAGLKPDVLHVQGLGFPDDLRALGARVPQPILVQDHADRVPRFWRRPRWRRSMAVASGVAFCARGQAQPFQAARLLNPRTRIYEIPESTSRFTAGEQSAARRSTGLFGEPCLLWVGHLDANKDLRTVLTGLSQVVERFPDLRLWCYFASAPLLSEIEQYLRATPQLRERVRLMGRAPHAQIEQAMRAADFFVLGSHREGSGYSLIEALACGLPPVVTDIPSFRALTAEGAVGALWKCNQGASFAQALLRLAAQPREQLRSGALAHFERELSFAAVGRKLVGAYEDLRAHATSAAPPHS